MLIVVSCETKREGRAPIRSLSPAAQLLISASGEFNLRIKLSGFGVIVK
jgi:hypothetical protein